MTKLIMPTDIFYDGTLYLKNVMYDLPSDFAKLVEAYREKELKELTKKAELDEVSPAMAKALEESSEDAEVKPRTVRRKPLEDTTGEA